VYEIAKQVPVAVGYGSISLGKSRAVQAAQAMLGLSRKFRITKITDKQALRIAEQSTLGFTIDDPSSPLEFAEKVLMYFERGTLTSCKSSYRPRSTFTVTLNMECLEKFACMPKR
jgi:hypothetical protein